MRRRDAGYRDRRTAGQRVEQPALKAGPRRHGADGVICGHIHKAEMREIEKISATLGQDVAPLQPVVVVSASGEVREELRSICVTT